MSSSNDFLQNEDRKNEKLHPAVFVGIEKETGIVKVVVMSTTFTEQNVPSHLRASVGVYFPGVIKFYGTVKDFLTERKDLFNVL